MLPVWLPALIHILEAVEHRKHNNLVYIFKIQHTKPDLCHPDPEC